MSKKDEAFRLFDEGKKPSDPELKALGLSPKTRYNYYQDHKKTRGGDLSGVSEIQELQQEKIKLTLTSQIEELKARREQLPERVGRLERQVRKLAKWLDEDKFEYQKAVLFIVNELAALRNGKAINKDSVEDMMEDAEKGAAECEREREKYIDRIEGI